METRFGSTFIGLVSLLLLLLSLSIASLLLSIKEYVCFSTLSKTIVIFFFCYGIHALDIDLNGPGKCKDLSLKPHFFSNIYLEGGRTSSGLLFRLRCFASPRKRLFCPFLLGLRCHHTDGWQASQSSRYHSKCHNWTRFFTIEHISQLDKMHSFFPANIVWTKI